MTAQALLESLQARGAVLTIDGTALWIEPADVLTDADCEVIRQLKPKLHLYLVEASTQHFTYAGDVYDPQEAREHAWRDSKATQKQRAYMRTCAEIAARTAPGEPLLSADDEKCNYSNNIQTEAAA